MSKKNLYSIKQKWKYTHRRNPRGCKDFSSREIYGKKVNGNQDQPLPKITNQESEEIPEITAYEVKMALYEERQITNPQN